MKKQSELMGYVLLAIGCGILLMSSSGCAGIEVGGRLGVYRVDERQESQKTYRNENPAICYVFPSRCKAPETEVSGS